MKTHRISLSRLRQWRCKVQPRCKVATDYSILDFAGQAQQTKGRLKNINVNGQTNVSGLLVFYQVIFMVNLP